jgi:epoxyqueuosine reductase
MIAVDSTENTSDPRRDWPGLVERIRGWGKDLGFTRVGIADLDVTEAADRLDAWLAAGRHGAMEYMQRHAHIRRDPTHLLSNARRAIVVRMDYLPAGANADWVEREQRRIRSPGEAVISIYARGRDYHKVLRQRLQTLAARIETEVGSFGYRVTTDSAPVMEVELARAAGLGWRGKHTLLLSQDAGSTFFLGEILTDLPLPVDAPEKEHCGTCARCIEACPTQAITGPYEIDARRCISYLTIELPGSIPVELRPLIGNRVYGCDDCQLACPWNKFARTASVADFDVRHGLDASTLVELFAWTEREFNDRHEGSAIRRIGYARWLRNIAVGLGNAAASPEVTAALNARVDHPDPVVREHVAWALARHAAR